MQASDYILWHSFLFYLFQQAEGIGSPRAIGKTYDQSTTPTTGRSTGRPKRFLLPGSSSTNYGTLAKRRFELNLTELHGIARRMKWLFVIRASKYHCCPLLVTRQTSFIAPCSMINVFSFFWRVSFGSWAYHNCRFLWTDDKASHHLLIGRHIRFAIILFGFTLSNYQSSSKRLIYVTYMSYFQQSRPLQTRLFPFFY